MRSSETGKEVQSKEFMRQCSCGENSLSISPSPGQVYLIENPFPFSSPVTGNLTDIGKWDDYIYHYKGFSPDSCKVHGLQRGHQLRGVALLL